MASSTCHVVGVTKRVRVERIVRRDHPAEVKSPQGRLNRSLDDRTRPANCQRRTLRSRTRWADNVSASTRRTRQPKPIRETWECWSALPAKWPKPAVRNQSSEEHTSELQSLMRISYAVLRLKKKPASSSN